MCGSKRNRQLGISIVEGISMMEPEEFKAIYKCAQKSLSLTYDLDCGKSCGTIQSIPYLLVLNLSVQVS